MQFACNACGHPAVTLPEELHDLALVSCQGCGAPVGTWAEFKRRTTQVILSATRTAPAEALARSPDPLDLGLIRQRITSAR